MSRAVAVAGRWLVDEPSYAAMQISLPHSDARLMVSVTVLDAGKNPLCTLAVACEHDKLTLELIAGLRIHFDDLVEPDLAMYLTDMIATPEFRRRVLTPFVAEMQASGMY